VPVASSGFELEGRELRKTPTAVPLSTAAPLSTNSSTAPYPAQGRSSPASHARDWRLHKHADYQRVYQASRKQFSTLLTYFVAAQSAESANAGPRVGITAGKVLGKAVERNRIKRRMRAAIVGNLEVLHCGVDVVLHPKRIVLTAEWTALRNEVRRIFVKIEEAHAQGRPQDVPERKA
jgi:ribonuclease P protein component